MTTHLHTYIVAWSNNPMRSLWLCFLSLSKSNPTVNLSVLLRRCICLWFSSLLHSGTASQLAYFNSFLTGCPGSGVFPILQSPTSSHDDLWKTQIRPCCSLFKPSIDFLLNLKEIPYHEANNPSPPPTVFHSHLPTVFQPHCSIYSSKTLWLFHPGLCACSSHLSSHTLIPDLAQMISFCYLGQGSVSLKRPHWGHLMKRKQ